MKRKYTTPLIIITGILIICLSLYSFLLFITSVNHKPDTNQSNTKVYDMVHKLIEDKDKEYVRREKRIDSLLNIIVNKQDSIFIEMINQENKLNSSLDKLDKYEHKSVNYNDSTNNSIITRIKSIN